MIRSETSVWNGDIQPRVRRNTKDHDLIVVDLTGKQCDDQTSRLMASGTAEARVLAQKLRDTADALDAMADAIDREAAAAAEAVA